MFDNVDDPVEFISDSQIIALDNCDNLVGFHIDNKLNLGDHISYIDQKVIKVSVLARLSNVLNEINKMLNVNLITFVHYGIFVPTVIHLR